MKKQTINYKLNALKKTILIVFVFFMTFLGINAQTIVKGTILAADDNTPLYAATVMIQWTTIGTVSDYNGEYILPIQPGTHTLQVSYMGYEIAEVEITINENETVVQDFALVPSTITGKEIVITAQAKGQLAAVNKQVNSKQIVNVVSAERIKEFPDDNAAQSISRLPGVHLDGNKVVIRGIQPKMNKILINGVEIPSTEAEDRSVNLNMISSNMLSGIEVYKSITPDMDADAIGGVVNLRLQEAPEGLNYSITQIGEYSGQEKNGDYKIWTDISNRFFNNKFGASFNFNYNLNNGGSDRISTSYEPLDQTDRDPYIFNDLKVEDRISKSKSIGSSLILDYKINNGKIIVNSLISSGNDENITYTDDLEARENRRKILISHNKNKTLLLSHSIQYEQQIGIFKIDGMLSHISYKKDPEFDYDYSFQATGNGFYSDSLTNQRRQSMQPWDMYSFAIPDAINNMNMNAFNWKPENFNEKKSTAMFNVEVPVNIFKNLTIKLKTGFKYVSMYRENDKTRMQYPDAVNIEPVHAPMKDYLISLGHTEWTARIPFEVVRDYDFKTNDNFMNGEPYNMKYAVDVDITKKMAVDLMDHSTLGETQDVYKDDYWGGERLTAGYFMAEINLWNRLLIIPGFRYEKLVNDYSALKVHTPAKLIYNVIDTLNEPVTHEHLLPHLHTKLNVTKWLDVRFSYNKTLSRPDYNNAIPLIFYNTVDGSGEAGNPYIKPAVSENFDLNFSVHHKKIGLITAGIYYKNIDDLFYSQKMLIKNIPDTNIINQFPIDEFPPLETGKIDFFRNNTRSAFIKGFELEWQSNLSYLPKPFNGLVFNANYTKAWSEAKYQYFRKIDEVLFEPPWLISHQSDTIIPDGLIHQADDIGNISMGYDYKDFSLRFSFRYQGKVLNNIEQYQEQDTYKRSYYQFDLALKQSIPIKFAIIEVFFNAINLTNVPDNTYAHYASNYSDVDTKLIYNGRRYQLGLRIKNATK